MSNSNLYDPLQSAYRSKHSTETAVLKIQNDIIGNLDIGMCTVLTSLDLSAAFDTVDHAILLRRLNFLYGVDGVCSYRHTCATPVVHSHNYKPHTTLE